MVFTNFYNDMTDESTWRKPAYFSGRAEWGMHVNTTSDHIAPSATPRAAWELSQRAALSGQRMLERRGALKMEDV